MPTCFDFAVFETVELISGAESAVTETSPAAVIVVFRMYAWTTHGVSVAPKLGAEQRVDRRERRVDRASCRRPSR